MNLLKYFLRMTPSPLGYISAILLLVFTAGVYKQLTQKTANNCEMTFMFEYPHFVVSDITPRLLYMKFIHVKHFKY